jgi:hypothetical protein
MNTPAPNAGRTSYHTPVLRDHGTVAEITLTKFIGGEDDGAVYVGSAHSNNGNGATS